MLKNPVKIVTQARNYVTFYQISRRIAIMLHDCYGCNMGVGYQLLA